MTPTPRPRALGPRQLEWCRQKWPHFEKNRVQRLEHAAAACRIAELIDAARPETEVPA